MITNAKIERKKKDITRTEVKFAEVKAKLREQKIELRILEDEEIVAMFRNDIINEDDLALIRARREAEAINEEELVVERISAAQFEKEDNN